MLTYIVVILSGVTAILAFWISSNKNLSLNKWGKLLTTIIIFQTGFSAYNLWLKDKELLAYSTKQLRVLWVDDHHPSKELFSKIEEVGGFVSYASTNFDALELIKNHQFTHIVTDNYRVGFDGKNAGYDLIQALKNHEISIPVLMLSDTVENFDESNIDEHGFVVSNNSTEILSQLLRWKGQK